MTNLVHDIVSTSYLLGEASINRTNEYKTLPRDKNEEAIYRAGLLGVLEKAREATKTDWQIEVYYKETENSFSFPKTREELIAKTLYTLYCPCVYSKKFKMVSFYRLGCLEKESWVVPSYLIYGYLDGLIDGRARVLEKKYNSELWNELKANRLKVEEANSPKVLFKTLAEARAKGVKFNPSQHIKTQYGYTFKSNVERGDEELGSYGFGHQEIVRLVYEANKITGYEYKIYSSISNKNQSDKYCSLNYYNEATEENCEVIFEFNARDVGFKRDENDSLEVIAAYLQGVCEI